MGKLYLVGTPIGNLGDITLRAIDTLKNADLIACEDTRHSLKLLSHLQINKPLFSCHKFNEHEATAKIAKYLDEDKTIALITDAGMPCISDPGAIVVNDLFDKGYDIEVVPGPTAVTSAMALSGITRPVWTFIGFLPDKNKERKALLEDISKYNSALVFYSSPYDINKDLEDMYKIFGDRTVHIIKEITKMHEHHEMGKLNGYHIEEPKGEYVIVVEHPQIDNSKKEVLPIEEQLKIKLDSGLSKKDAIKQVAKENNLPKDDVYKIAIDM